MSRTSSAPIVLFDGVCNLCNSSVQWVMDRDRKGVFRFAPLDSEEGLRWVPAQVGRPDSVVLVDADGVHMRSTAALRICKHLGGVWGLLAIGLWVPARLRDAVYDWIARNRYRWFGRADQCRVRWNQPR